MVFILRCVVFFVSFVIFKVYMFFVFISELVFVFMVVVILVFFKLNVWFKGFFVFIKKIRSFKKVIIVDMGYKCDFNVSLDVFFKIFIFVGFFVVFLLVMFFWIELDFVMFFDFMIYRKRMLEIEE